MRALTRARGGNDRGAMLIQVAISILMLMGFTVFVIDYGVVLVGRGQAQNAADAGALAGVLARAFDDTADPPATGGVAWNAATQAAAANLVWREPGVAEPSWDCPAGTSGRCVRVDVYRDGSHGSATLPVFFGHLFGIDSQRVKATATARVVYGNATDCIRPWGVADKWTEVRAPTTQFNKWDKVGSAPVMLSPHDDYVAPSEDGAGTGFRLPDDFGAEITLKNGNPSNDNDPITPGWFLPLRLPDGQGGYNTGASDMRDEIAGCIGVTVKIGDYLPLEDGAMIGPTNQGFDLLKAKDPDARWVPTPAPGLIADSCAPSAGCGSFSPRVVALPVFDIDEFQFHRAGGISPGESSPWSQCPMGGKCVRVVNILGFFADRMEGTDVIGYLYRYPGIITAGSSVSDDASFLVTVQLIR